MTEEKVKNEPLVSVKSGPVRASIWPAKNGDFQVSISRVYCESGGNEDPQWKYSSYFWERNLDDLVSAVREAKRKLATLRQEYAVFQDSPDIQAA